MRHDKINIGSAGQWLSGVLVLLGIIVEIVLRASFALVCITVGSLCFAIFTKIRYYKNKK